MAQAFVCEGVRTPIGRYAGALAQVRTDDLAAHPITTLCRRLPDADWERLDEVILGCTNQAGEDNRNVARMASLLAGLPVSVPAFTVNRLCASGLQAVASAAHAIAAGEIEIAIAGGVESMSRAPLVMPKAASAFARNAEIYDSTLGWRFVNPEMEKRYGADSMGQTAENVAMRYKIEREAQDQFALRSQQRTAAAKEAAFFDDEIEPVSVPGPKGQTKSVSEDEHPRPETTIEALRKLSTPFRKDGSVTAGNSSGINDGACALLVATEKAAVKFGLTPKARILSSAAAGVEPSYMGVGPIPAVQRLLGKVGFTINDIDLVELNEAFAAQVLAVTRALGLPDDSEKINPNGGAIALGHPLGMSGARLVLTATRQLQRARATRALVTMCIGVGQGMAMMLERV
ncbi:MAG TPA: 3-oxoadipyl-CoA thiolase [Terriglobales bacterium]|nr:3-oxoadipyl-CoA thiolase [Terriglobales bacterium]